MSPLTHEPVKGYLVTLKFNPRNNIDSPLLHSAFRQIGRVFKEKNCDQCQTYHLQKQHLSFEEQDIIEDWVDMGNSVTIQPYFEDEIVTLTRDNNGTAKWVILSPPKS